MSVNLLLIFFVLIVVAMIAFILVQKGTGATAGSAFGAGASSTVFGAKGSGNFLTKTTMILAFLFFAISMFMAVNASKQFTAATTGEVDLGVIGKLDTSDSDVPEITPIDSADTSQGGDVPTLDESAANVDSTTVSDVPVIEDVINKVIDGAEEAVEQNTEEIKSDIIEKAEDVKDSVDS